MVASTRKKCTQFLGTITTYYHRDHTRDYDNGLKTAKVLSQSTGRRNGGYVNSETC